jgi:predicted Rossmann-fold nucleotide-binding protein
MHFEIESREALQDHLHRHGDLTRVVVQGVDLAGEGALFDGVAVDGAVFLGGRLDDEVRARVQAGGGLIFPALPDLPFQPYRARLYSPEELMAGYRRGDPASHADCLDQRIYRYYDAIRRRGRALPVIDALAQRLHDHAIDDALDDLLHGARPRKVVAVMGGHAMLRTDPGYREVALIGRRLTRSDPALLVATGGGPGAMEAATLGAWLADYPPAALDAALATLARAPDYHHPAWLDSAFEVREAYPDHRDSLGIPTWFYGHEPPNLFAAHIAKYFSNSLREDGLLSIAHHGVIFAPGSAGTIQEIFQDAAQNHYGVHGDVSPMVFLGRDYWTRDKPVFPLLEGLARGRPYAEMLAVVDGVDEAVDFLAGHPPVAYRG